MNAESTIVCEGNVSYLRFGLLDNFPELVYGMFTRKGGKSGPPFDSLNVGENVGDDAAIVAENRRIVLSAMGGGHLVSLTQVHGSKVVSVGRDDLPWGSAVEADALVTDIPGVILLIKVADCQPVLIYDYKKRVVANVHSGWRGSVENILGDTLHVMTDDFGCDPATMVAAIGPSLGPCCAEFVDYKREIPEPLWMYKDDAHHFDFWRMSRDQLAQEGVPEEHIAVAGMCTRCRTDLFFSYRKEGTTGRLACVIGLKDKTRTRRRG